MKKIGRNEPCLCGSGKKYKHCCAAKKPATITALLEAEVFQLEQDILHFAVRNYEDNIDAVMEIIFEEVEIEDDEEFDKAGFFLMLWIIFSLPILENRQTILQKYIEKHHKKIKRPALQGAIVNWADAAPSIYKVLTESDEVLHVEDVFTSEEKQIHFGGPSETLANEQSIEGHYVLGTVVEYQNRSAFFTTFYVIRNQTMIDDIVDLYNLYCDEYSPKHFIEELFPEIIEIIFNGRSINFEEIQWDTEQQMQVIQLVKENLVLSNEMEKPIEGLATTLWKIYCTKTGANIRSIPKYAAALHYIVSYFYLFFGEDELTKEEVAAIYAIKLRTLKETVNKLEDVLEDDIDQLLDELTFGFEEELYDAEADFDFLDEEDDEDDEFDFFDAEADFIELDALFKEDANEELFDSNDLFRKIVANQSIKSPKKQPVIDELEARRKTKQKNKIK